MSNQPQGPFQAYPQYPGANAAPEKRPVPQSVRRAFYAMLAGAGLQLVGIAVGLSQGAQLRDKLRTQHPLFTDNQINSASTLAMAVIAFSGAIDIGLWIWMAYANRSGHNWARIVATVFFGISCMTLIIDITLSSTGVLGGTSAASPVSTGVGVITWLVGLFALIMLWSKQSSEFFKPQPSAVQPYPYGQPGPYPGMQPPLPPTQQAPYGAPQPPTNPWDTPPHS